MFMDMRDEAIQKRCVPTPWQMGPRPMVVGIWQMDYPMAMGMQRTGIRPMAVGTRCLSDNLDPEATCLCQGKMIKIQQTGIRPMATGTQQINFDPKA